MQRFRLIFCIYTEIINGLPNRKFYLSKNRSGSCFIWSLSESHVFLLTWKVFSKSIWLIEFNCLVGSRNQNNSRQTLYKKYDSFWIFNIIYKIQQMTICNWWQRAIYQRESFLKCISSTINNHSAQQMTMNSVNFCFVSENPDQSSFTRIKTRI